MSIKLYGLGPSRSFRCLWALAEAGVEHEFISLQLGSAEDDGAQSQHYTKLNQQGKVPTLVDDGFVLTESAAILNYINALSKANFVPNEIKARAKYDELSYFILSELEQPLWTTGKHKFAIPEEYRRPDIFSTAQWEFKKALGALAQLIDLNEYALGNKFTFADILLAQTFNWADRFKFDLPPNYLDYRDKMYARPAAVSALARC